MKKTKNSKSESENGAAKKPDRKDFLIVGIGASAGGIKALKEFFAAMPPDAGMAFVVILHLSQEHESSLAQILQSETQMRVEQVTETVKVEPNNVYVIPPAKGLAMVDGHIQLTEPERIKGKRVPIDLFFRTLADAYGEKGIAVVLSGTGSDGTLGLKRIKENGGIGIAQEPLEAEYDGMPRSAINTGLVDLVLPVGEIPERLIGFQKNGGKIRLPQEKDEIPRPAKGKEPDALNEILAIVRVRTGHDFSAYKHATVLRRIARRLQVHELSELSEYLVFLRGNPEEAERLQRDLLITVTNFFRDKEAFETLEKEVVPKLFTGKTSADTVRVWSVGCATGEEAYGLAMILNEYAARITNAPQIQIFASDINDEAIAKGRECFYEEPIAADVSVERLRHYFTKETGGFRVRKDLRETVLFAPHNILRDPPFSKLDLITCRNLLIYFNRETQAKVLEIFNFALRSDGFLFLGASESAESHSDLFAVADKKNRIYRARPVTRNNLPALPAPGRWNVRIPQLPIEPDNAPTKSYGEIHYKLVEQFAPPSVLVNEDYEIVHVSEHAGRFLRVAGGEPTRDLLKIIHPSLKLDLQSALFEAKKSGFVSESRNVRFARDEGGGMWDESGKGESDLFIPHPSALIPSESLVNITVRLVQSADTADGFYLVLFDESKSEAAPEEIGQKPQTVAGRDALDGIVRRLEQELQLNRERLRATIEQNETSSEELKASNEELQAINEELRSTTEELETSKEELQSLNEELTTVNAELRDKVDETVRVNSDLQNLVQSTDIGTIFLDRALRVKRYTPKVADVFNIIPSDIGRPLEHLTHKFDEDFLNEDASEVLKTLHLKEREVRGGTGDSRYLVRLAPYRTLDDKIDGVVVSFQDITALKRASDLLTESEERFSAIVRQTTAGMVQTDLTGKIVLANDRFCEVVGYRSDELLTMRLHDLTHAEDLPSSAELFQKTVTAGEPFAVEKRYVRKDGSDVWIHSTVTAILGADGKPKFILAVVLDISERRQTEQALSESEEKYRNLFNSIDEGFCVIEMIFDADEKPVDYRFLDINPSFEKQTGLTDAVGKTMLDFAPQMEKFWFEIYGKVALTGEPVRFENHAEQLHRWYDVYAFRVGEPHQRKVGVLFNDITERKRMEEELRESEARFRAMFEQANIGIVQIGFDGRFLAVNPGFCKIVGYSEKKLQKLTVRDITHPDDYEVEEAENQKLIAGEIFGYSFEKRLIHRTGSVVWGKMTATLVRRESGEPFYTLSIVEDITTHKQAEAALQESEERFRLLVESVTDYAIFAVNEAGLVVFWNTGAEKVFGYKEQEIIGKSGEILFTPEDRAGDVPEREIQTAAAVGRAEDERWHVRKDGSRFYASGVMTTLKDGKGFVKIARDMTDKIKVETALREKEMLQKMVGAQEDERKRIARDLHDHLGQQITALKLKLEAVRKMSENDVELSAKIDETQLIAKHIDADLDFLAWELRPAALDDLGLLAALENYVKEWSRHSGVTAEFFTSGLSKERFVPEVETNLYRIAQEALNNVYKHANAKRASLILEKRAGLLILIVEDDGIGFDADDKETRQNGLGLIGMKERAALVGGTKEIESEKGAGTTIYVRVPLAELKNEVVN